MSKETGSVAVKHCQCILISMPTLRNGAMNDGDTKGTMPPLVVCSGSTWVQTTSMQG